MSPKVKISPESKKGNGKENLYSQTLLLNNLLQDPFQNKKLFK